MWLSSVKLLYFSTPPASRYYSVAALALFRETTGGSWGPTGSCCGNWGFRNFEDLCWSCSGGRWGNNTSLTHYWWALLSCACTSYTHGTGTTAVRRLMEVKSTELLKVVKNPHWPSVEDWNRKLELLHVMKKKRRWWHQVVSPARACQHQVKSIWKESPREKVYSLSGFPNIRDCFCSFN